MIYYSVLFEELDYIAVEVIDIDEQHKEYKKIPVNEFAQWAKGKREV